MVGFLLVSHGSMAKGMLQALTMIAGEQEQVSALGLYEEDSPDELSNRVHEEAEKLDTGDGVLIFVDMFGASPFNASARVLLQNQDRIDLICGMNLPMLLELSMSRDGMNRKELAEAAVNAGKESVSQFIIPSENT